MKLGSLASIGVLFVSGCGTVIDGTMEASESITFVSTPPGGAIKAPGRTICHTPCKRDVENYLLSSLYAELDGYVPVQIDPKAKANVNVLGNVIVGGIPGLGIDVLTGRAVRYDDLINIEFAPRPVPMSGQHDNWDPLAPNP